MNGDILVKFTITGNSGYTVTLDRTEAEHLLKQLKIALRKTGKPQTQKDEPVRENLLKVAP
jgi:hypothetical protein